MRCSGGHWGGRAGRGSCEVQGNGACHDIQAAYSAQATARRRERAGHSERPPPICQAHTRAKCAETNIILTLVCISLGSAEHAVRTFTELSLRTQRLILRPPVLGDADALFAIFSDPETMRYWATPPWTTAGQAVARIEQDRECLVSGSALTLVLQPVDGGPIVGRITLFAFVSGSQRAEVGYILARSAWGKGLNHEALHALLNYGFGTLALRRVEADIDPRNKRSASALERFGFIQEGYLRERWLVGSEISDTALYGLLSKDWLAMQAQA